MAVSNLAHVMLLSFPFSPLSRALVVVSIMLCFYWSIKNYMWNQYMKKSSSKEMKKKIAIKIES